MIKVCTDDDNNVNYNDNDNNINNNEDVYDDNVHNDQDKHGDCNDDIDYANKIDELCNN